MPKLGRALIYLVSVWVLYAQHVALTHVFAHLQPALAAAQQAAIDPEPEPSQRTPNAGLCAFDATLSHLLIAAPGEDFGHPVLVATPVPTLALAPTHIGSARLHPQSRGPPALL